MTKLYSISVRVLFTLITIHGKIKCIQIYNNNQGTDWVLFKVSHKTNPIFNSFLLKLQNSLIYFVYLIYIAFSLLVKY